MSSENTPISQVLRQRLLDSNTQFFANDSIASVIESPEELAELQKEVEARVLDLLNSLVIDVENDHNSMDTAARVAKMFIRENYRGRYEPMPSATDFPNVSNPDQLVIVGPIEIRSVCAHHHMPIFGKMWVGFLPGERLLGLSKFSRLADWVFSRPSIQEESLMTFCNLIEEMIEPIGLGVVLSAHHTCCSHRGVKDKESRMTSSVMRGAFRETPALRTEFLALVEQSKN